MCDQQKALEDNLPTIVFIWLLSKINTKLSQAKSKQGEGWRGAMLVVLAIRSQAHVLGFPFDIFYYIFID